MKSRPLILIKNFVTSPPSRGAWIEIKGDERYRNIIKSPPSRGAWIEI